MRMKKFKAIIAALILVFSFNISVYASENLENSLDVQTENESTTGEQVLPTDKQLQYLDQSKTGEIKIHLTDGAQGTNKSDILFYCSKVADIEKGEYVLYGDYTTVQTDLNTIENSVQLTEAAKKFAEKGYMGKEAKTDSNGDVAFNDLEVGVYLIQARHTSDYDEVSPTLIAIPTWSEDKGEMTYSVLVEPKHTPQPTKVTNIAPQTGLQDYTRYYLFGAGLCLIGSVIFLFAVIRRRHHEK